MDHPDGYPEDLQADVLLRDGRPCHLRPITPQDAPALAEFHRSLSPETVYLRFFAPDRYELVGKALNERDLEDPAPEAV